MAQYSNETLVTTKALGSGRAAMAPSSHRPVNRLSRLIRGLASSIVDVVTPPVCLSCHAPLADQQSVCPSCWRQIDFIRHPLCDRLGLPLPYDAGPGAISAEAAASPPVFARARAVARYDGVMRDLIHDFKFRDRHDAVGLFGRWMAEAGRELLADADVIVPVPLHRLKLFQRRFNQAAILALELSRLTGITAAPLGLVRTRRTTSQLGLTRDRRRANVKSAFLVPPHLAPAIEGRRILLVDDVITTGATVSAAASALLAAGAQEVDVLGLGLVTDTASTLLA